MSFQLLCIFNSCLYRGVVEENKIIIIVVTTINLFNLLFYQYLFDFFPVLFGCCYDSEALQYWLFIPPSATTVHIKPMILISANDNCTPEYWKLLGELIFAVMVHIFVINWIWRNNSATTQMPSIGITTSFCDVSRATDGLDGITVKGESTITRLNVSQPFKSSKELSAHHQELN